MDDTDASTAADRPRAADPEAAGSDCDPDPAAADLQATYDRIASHFSKTREYAWPEVEQFCAGRAGRRGLDVGCGNGRHTALLAECTEHAIGGDVSRGLLDKASERARERGYADRVDFVQCAAERLPFAAGTIDIALYVATIHHLSPRTERVASLNALARVLTDDGRALVSAWSTAHDRFDQDEASQRPNDDSEHPTGFDTTVDWTLPGGTTVPRY